MSNPAIAPHAMEAAARALRRLENGGIRIEPAAEGGVAWENTWPGEAPPQYSSLVTRHYS